MGPGSWPRQSGSGGTRSAGGSGRCTDHRRAKLSDVWQKSCGRGRDRLGGTESVAEHPGTMTHSDIPPDRQAELGITPAMIRLSVGVEHPEDLIADITRALEAV